MGYAGITNQDVAPHPSTFSMKPLSHRSRLIWPLNHAPLLQIFPAPMLPGSSRIIQLDYSKTTPFRLTGSATDANAGDVLTYCWEQDDNQPLPVMPVWPARPKWLSFSPTTSPTRICPRLSTILAGLYVTPTLPGGDAIANIEALSSVGRNLEVPPDGQG